MNPALHINKEGIVCYIADCPEDRWGHGCPNESHCSQDSVAFCEQFCGCYNAYQQALQAAKDSAVECASQIEAENIIWSDYVSRRPSDAWVGLISDTIHPFPEGYSVEIRTPEIYYEDRGWFWEKRAYITPKKEEPKQEESQEDLCQHTFRYCAFTIFPGLFFYQVDG